ncbi:CFI-box-CTERM domain-containing protein [Burkholderia cepacia]|uniref:CFI-box-CTERM domain-containing protein n=1 Tax=Burkholderia cepacia TaxID=292 RepID=UPI001E412651|nr:CFI-box-CTERM domain-containing protein [Burkholderia cepacia]
MRKYHTITRIVDTVYCEQKATFDRQYGDARPLSVRAKAAAGTFEHVRFQVEGKTRAAVDRRCFIATAVYGEDARETNFLRSWRDRVLLSSVVGRLLTACYYLMSPRVARALERSPRAARVLRIGLDCIVSLLGMPR